MRINEDDMITQADAARIRGVSHEAIRNLVQRGRLKAYRIGGKIFLSRKDVEAFEPDVGGRPKKKKSQTKTNRRAKKVRNAE